MQTAQPTTLGTSGFLGVMCGPPPSHGLICWPTRQPSLTLPNRCCTLAHHPWFWPTLCLSWHSLHLNAWLDLFQGVCTILAPAASLHARV